MSVWPLKIEITGITDAHFGEVLYRTFSTTKIGQMRWNRPTKSPEVMQSYSPCTLAILFI